MISYHITSQRDYSLEEFVDFFNANHPRLQPALSEVAAGLSPNTTITAICYDYPTSDLHGEKLMMSSLLLILRQNGEFSAQNLWLENRATQISDNNVPTHQWNIGEVHVLRHHVLVAPDLMGYGTSINQPICYCCGQLAARNTVDAVMAAQQILMDDYLIESPLPVLNSGHSQGSFDALAIHRYMETKANDEEKKLFPLVRTWCADGPYAPDVVTRVGCRWEKYLYGAYMVLNAMSHMNYHPEYFEPDVHIEDFLTEEGLALHIVDAILSRRVGNKELVKMVVGAIGMRTSRLFREEVYREDGRLYQMIMRCSEAERQIDGWTPALPIDFYHVHADECVPVEAMHEVKRLWGDLPNVSFEDDMTPIESIPNAMAHAWSGGVFHRRLLKMNY